MPRRSFRNETGVFRRKNDFLKLRDALKIANFIKIVLLFLKILRGKPLQN